MSWNLDKKNKTLGVYQVLLCGDISTNVADSTIKIGALQPW